MFTRLVEAFSTRKTVPGGMRFSPDHCPNGRRCKRKYLPWSQRQCSFFWQCTEGKDWKNGF